MGLFRSRILQTQSPGHSYYIKQPYNAKSAGVKIRNLCELFYLPIMPEAKEEPRVTKQFVQAHTDGKEIDLSVCELSTVPVKELVSIYVLCMYTCAK